MFPHRDNFKLSPNFFPALETGDNRWAPDHGCMWDVSVIVSVFAKLRKTTVSFVVSVSRPAAWDNSAPNGRIFMKFES
jgi:hypothetical protein